MKISLSGSLVLAATLGWGVISPAKTASAEPASSKPGKAAPSKNESTKDKSPTKDGAGKAQPEASAESKPEAQAEDKPEAKPELAPAATPQPPESAKDRPERKVSPFGEAPSSDVPPAPPGHAYPSPGFPWYGYPTPGYPPPGYGYPPPVYGYPPPGYGYPPPGHPIGGGHPRCRFCPYHPGDGELALPPEQRPGYHSHDGFFLRLGLGGGYARTSKSVDGDKLTYSGASVAFNLAIGASIAPNLILFGEVISDQITSDSDTYVGVWSDSRSMRVDNQGFGPGLAYYFMPINLYVSGSLLLHKVSYTFDDDDFDSKDLSSLGFAANLMTGKEWWVSPNWGIGLAAHVMLGTAKERSSFRGSTDGRWNSMAFGLLMSATYN